MTVEQLIRLAVVTVADVPYEERADRAASARIDLLETQDAIAARWPDRPPVVVPVPAAGRVLADLEAAADDALDEPWR